MAGESEEAYVKEIEALRREKDYFFREDPESPIPQSLRASFTGLAYFPIDPKYRIRAKLVRDLQRGPPGHGPSRIFRVRDRRDKTTPRRVQVRAATGSPPRGPQPVRPLSRCDLGQGDIRRRPVSRHRGTADG